MIERLTAAELADVADSVADGRCALCHNGPRRATCPQCEGTGAFSLATSAMESIVTELVERRLEEGGDARAETLDALLVWARERCESEVANRPDQNHHKRILDATWKQVIAKLESMRRPS